MDAALHDPEHGYYARRIRNVGARGDFSTTPTLSPALGQAVSQWVLGALRDSGSRDLIELGPGSGELAQAILESLPWHRRARLRLHLVETSEPLRKIQESRLGKKRVRWHRSAAEALGSCQGAACIYSNEFVDAFPVRRFKTTPAGWLEEFVTPGESHWQLAADLPESSAFTRDWKVGQVVEVHESYHQWLRDTLPHWKRGRMLTIDYGNTVDQLYHRSPDASLRGYFHHQWVTGTELLERPGHQDLTTDVNFTDLIEWAKPKLTVVSQFPQSEFIAPHVDTNRPADAFVADQFGAGGAFQCLDQRVV